MSALPKAVIVGHRTYTIRKMPLATARRRGISGECNFDKGTIWVRTEGHSGPEVANTLLHEVLHAAWNEGNLRSRAEHEHAVTVLANVLTQVIRDNPKVFDWIAEKARS